MTIQRLSETHAPAYRALMLQAYALHPDAFTSSAAERAALPLSWWRARLSAEPDAKEVVLGVFVDGTLCGVLGLAFDAREKARHKATLFGMYLAADLRGQGLGRKLVDAALSLARARPGVRLVQLTVTHGNDAAQALYTHCGFVPFGLEPYAVATDTGFVDKLHMWCNLNLPPDCPTT